MTLIIQSNEFTANPKHFTVKDIFYGFTTEEKSNWFIDLDILVVIPDAMRIDFNYLQLNTDSSPHTFNRLFYSVFGKENKPIKILINRAVPFSCHLSVSDIDNNVDANLTINVIQVIKSSNSIGQLAKRLFLDELDNTIATWDYDESINHPLLPALPTGSNIVSTLVSSNIRVQIAQHKLYPATNSIWNSQLIPGINNIDRNEYYKGDSYVFDRYFKLNSNNSDLYNETDMTNPYTIEIHKALQANLYLTDDGTNDPTGQHTLDWFIKNSASEKITAIWKALGGDKFATNSINPLVDRVSNLGWYVQNIARVLGIRVDDNGKIDRAKEKSIHQPLTLQDPSYGNSNNNYSLTCWGDKGRMSPYLPNTYKYGKLQNLFDVYSDIPQMLEACMRQLNTSLSIQHGSEIRVRGLDNKVQSYPNQLAVSLECLHRLEKINLATQKSLVTGVVVGAEVRELFSLIGVPVTNKYLPLYDSATGRTVQLPYFGHQKNKPSLAGELATVKINLAVQTGMMAPKKSNNIFNPFRRLV